MIMRGVSPICWPYPCGGQSLFFTRVFGAIQYRDLVVFIAGGAGITPYIHV